MNETQAKQLVAPFVVQSETAALPSAGGRSMREYQERSDLIADFETSTPSATASMTDRDAARYRWLRHTHLGELLALFHTTDMSDVVLDFVIDEAIERRKELKLDAPNIELGPMP